MCIIKSTINLIGILPAAVSPTADSPSYITESDPKEDLEEEGDEDPKEDPADYPADKDDDDEEESSKETLFNRYVIIHLKLEFYKGRSQNLVTYNVNDNKFLAIFMSMPLRAISCSIT
ncbi:hypothetical protein Tco_1462289 [Tanacetum coccineum]